jgi:hypothetical protein
MADYGTCAASPLGGVSSWWVLLLAFCLSSTLRCRGCSSSACSGDSRRGQSLRESVGAWGVVSPEGSSADRLNFPLAQAVDALKLMAARKVKGKVVLTV